MPNDASIDSRFEALKALAARSWSNIEIWSEVRAVWLFMGSPKKFANDFANCRQTVRVSGNPETIMRCIERLHDTVKFERAYR